MKAEPYVALCYGNPMLAWPLWPVAPPVCMYDAPVPAGQHYLHHPD